MVTLWQKNPNWQRMLSCAYTTQLLHSTVEVCWNKYNIYFIWINLCAKSRENSFQEVLKAVLFGVGVYLQQLTFWLSCGSPIRVSTMFILCEKWILFALARLSNNVQVWSFYFGGKLEIFVRVGSSRVSAHARRILSPVG